MNALIGIQQALLQRARTGLGGGGIQVSLFDSAAELMALPYLQARYGAGAPDGTSPISHRHRASVSMRRCEAAPPAPGTER